MNETPRELDRLLREVRLSHLLSQLDAAESATDPSVCPPKGKDHEAFHALLQAGGLVRAVAGWALRHVYGLSLDGLRMLPRQPGGLSQTALTSTKAHPDYIKSRLLADSHRHEVIGEKSSIDLPLPRQKNG